MVSVDRAAPIRFLRTAYDAADWIAVFLKTYRTGDVAQLLHVGVLVGRAFVPINCDALVHLFSIEIELFAERLHDELLQVF
mgnify:CR=1 FL=1